MPKAPTKRSGKTQPKAVKAGKAQAAPQEKATTIKENAAPASAGKKPAGAPDNILGRQSMPAGLDLKMIGVDTSGADTQEEVQETHQFISFRVEQAEYGVDIMAVREIKGWTEVTPLPNTPGYVRGVLNLRGIVVPIFDLRSRFGQGQTRTTPLHVIIIVFVAGRVMGVLVDAVSDILTVNSNQILPVPDIENRDDEKFLDGLVTAKDRMVALLNLERLFDIDMIVAGLSDD